MTLGTTNWRGWAWGWARVGGCARGCAGSARVCAGGRAYHCPCPILPYPSHSLPHPYPMPKSVPKTAHRALDNAPAPAPILPGFYPCSPGVTNLTFLSPL
jgi:hypothetical protein